MIIKDDGTTGSPASIILIQHEGCRLDVQDVTDLASLLLKMGYVVRRRKIAANGNKTKYDAIQIWEVTEDDTDIPISEVPIQNAKGKRKPGKPGQTIAGDEK